LLGFHGRLLVLLGLFQLVLLGLFQLGQTIRENAGCEANSQLLNRVVRELLEKNEIVRAGTYMSKILQGSIDL
jgi:hypothetical protein